MIKKVILCFVGVLAMYALMPAVNDVPVINTVQAKELEQHVWFYSDHGRACKIVCVKSNCADLFYAPYWGKQLKGWISNGKT